MDLGINSYDIVIKNDSFNHMNDYLDLKGKILLVSDDLIPQKYIDKFILKYPNSIFISFPHGENNKTIETYQKIMDVLMNNSFSRKDNIIALGGGLTSDIAGYAASTYMRGINFYIIPTTLLADVDASIGGKVAINYRSIKNMIGSFFPAQKIHICPGTFYQPKKVIIDPELLKTLSDRLFFEGLVEAIKMALTCNKELFELIENKSNRKEVEGDLENIIYQALKIKKDIVEKDEKEANLRKVLNFGNTVGHALETLFDGKLYHGEAVGIGMTYFVSDEIKVRLINLLKKFSLPYQDDFKASEIMSYIKHDKKVNEDKIAICEVNEIGKYQLVDIDLDKLEERIKRFKHEK